MAMRSVRLAVAFAVMLGGFGSVVGARPDDRATPGAKSPVPKHDESKNTHRTEAAASRAIAEFKPSAHGFKFVNFFRGSPLPDSLKNDDSDLAKSIRGTIEKNVKLPDSFGLCGGMSAAAADFFFARREVPDATKPPVDGTPLFRYLQQRQGDSLGQYSIMALKFAEWMKLPDGGEEGTGAKSLNEVPKILEALKSGRLVALGLVFTRVGEGTLWENHQVLVYGVTDSGEGDKRVVDFKTYDPNYPLDDGLVIRVRGFGEASKEKPGKTEAAGGESNHAPNLVTISRLPSKHKPASVRGFFVMPYSARTPPEDLK